MHDLNASHLLKKAMGLGLDDAICQVVEERLEQVRFSNNEITAAKEFTTVKAHFFAAKGKKKMQFVLENLGTMDEDLAQSVKLVDRMQESTDYHGIAHGPFSYASRSCDPAIGEVDAPDLASQAIEASTAERVAGVLFTSHRKIDFASPYTEVTDEQSYIELSVRAFQGEASGHGVCSAASLQDFAVEEPVETASDFAQQAVDPHSGKAGTYDIVFTPLCFATILCSGYFSFSGFFVDSGISFFRDKIGERVASQLFTLSNDGTCAEGIFSRKFDEEGVPTQKTPLIEEGVLKGYLHNTSTAHKFDTETTANAGLDVPVPQNLIINEGTHSVDELIAAVDHGLLVTNTWYTRFQNFLTGDFSTIPRDAILQIEQGKITESVKDIRISDNMLSVLQNIAALSVDTQQIHWWECDYPVFSPYVLVKDVSVTTSTQ